MPLDLRGYIREIAHSVSPREITPLPGRLYEAFRVAYLRFVVSSGLLGAAIAFYAVVCLAPLALFIGALLRYIYGPGGENWAEIRAVTRQLSPQASRLVLNEIQRFLTSPDSTLTNVVSILGFIWAGSRLFESVQIAINQIWPGRRGRSFLARKLLSIGMMLAFGVLLGTFMFMTTFAEGVRDWLRANAISDLGVFDKVYHPLSSGLVYTIGAVGFFLVYKIVPVQRVPTKSALVGALFASGLWNVMTPAFGLLIGRSVRNSVIYGSLAGVVLYALWAYFGSVILLMGAHLTAAWAEVFEGVGYHPRELDDEGGAVGEVQPHPHSPINAVILATGRFSPEAAAAAGTEHKGLVKLLGKASIEYVVEALRGVSLVERIAVVGPAVYRTHRVADRVNYIVQEEPQVTESMERAIAALGTEKAILLLAADTPLVTPAALNDFLSRCPEDADACYPVTRRKPTLELFPSRLFEFLPLQEGWITHTCVLLFRPRVLLGNRAFVDRFVAKRRNQWSAALALGLGVLLRFVLSWEVPLLRLGLADISRRLEKVTRAKKLVGMIVEYPEMALDIEKAADVPFIEEYLQGRKQAAGRDDL